jgi:hypothetical protein
METDWLVPIDKLRRFGTLEAAKDGDFSGITDHFEKVALSEIHMNKGLDQVAQLAERQQDLIVCGKRNIGRTAIHQIDNTLGYK